MPDCQQPHPVASNLQRELAVVAKRTHPTPRTVSPVHANLIGRLAHTSHKEQNSCQQSAHGANPVASNQIARRCAKACVRHACEEAEDVCDDKQPSLDANKTIKTDADAAAEVVEASASDTGSTGLERKTAEPWSPQVDDSDDDASDSSAGGCHSNEHRVSSCKCDSDADDAVDCDGDVCTSGVPRKFHGCCVRVDESGKCARVPPLLCRHAKLPATCCRWLKLLATSCWQPVPCRRPAAFNR